MRKFKLLVLSNHLKHSPENSLYPFMEAMRQHPHCGQIDIASSGHQLNELFFLKMWGKELFVNRVDETCLYHPEGRFFHKDLRPASTKEYDAIWLRMPPPLSKKFLNYLSDQASNTLIINSPKGIYETGSKKFLLNFPDLCPPMQFCTSIEDIIDFKCRFPIVLKPLRDYGGNGLVRIDHDQVWEGEHRATFETFIQKIKDSKIEYLGVKFLKNVSLGDKRIVVIDGQIMGAALRLPAKNSWICNVAKGGQSVHAEISEEEKNIIECINPLLAKKGILMYGVDTLVDDNGRRVLSEINTTSIGGLPHMAKQSGRPLLSEAADLIWNYINLKTVVQHVVTNG